MHEYLKVLGNVIPLFLIMGIGAVVRGRGILTGEADRTLLELTKNLLLPCLILDHVMASPALRQWDNLVWSPLLGFGTTAAGVGIAALAARAGQFPRAAQIRTFAFVAGICNYGYIPVPLVDALYGPGALAVLFLFNLGTETAFWTVGFGTMEGRPLLRDWRRAFTTPVRAILLGMAINLITACFGLRLDDATLESVSWGWPVELATSTIHLIGLCSIPLALLLIGATMADFWREFMATRGAKVMALGVIVRNLVCPAGLVLLAWLLPVSKELRETLVVLAAMPAGVFSLVLARHHAGDVPVALQVIFSTMTAALITLPLWIHFGMQIIGVR